MNKRSSRRSDRGAAAVEMAIVLPLLLLVLGGVVDFGRAFFTQIVLSNAAREGVRAASISTMGLPDVTQRARAAATGIEGGPPAMSVSMTPSPKCVSGANATVTVSAPFTWIILKPALKMIGGANALPATLSYEATMRCGG
jgi:Flp pilus assembly protein TadG